MNGYLYSGYPIYNSGDRLKAAALLNTENLDPEQRHQVT
jgi:hypothetical protein